MAKNRVFLLAAILPILACNGEAITEYSMDWVSTPGGTFMMGSDMGDLDEQPVHQVTIPSFEISRTEVTVAQYRACVEAGECTEPPWCNWRSNWGVAGRENHPVSCVDWQQAIGFCTWIGGRLPTEAEWEYAARNGGQDITYPWGDDSASCSYAVMYEDGDGCGLNNTWAVCSKTAGNTAQGLCDMAGNVWEWVQDCAYSHYDHSPADGSAWEDCPSDVDRIARGGSFFDEDGHTLRVSDRAYRDPAAHNEYGGFRCTR